MNVLFFLKPKGELAYLYEDHTLRQGIEKLERSGFTAIPVISRSGEYIGTITEGDFLWTLKNKFSLDLKMAEDVPIQTVKRRMRFDPISIDSNMEDLVSKARNQNFVPVIDDKKIFIGIVTRKDIIDFCYQEYIEKEGKS
ncbi:MAG: CBS domain-containing protein [Lachnospiraceae bacterium]|nr:CBS domain-containing protein [Lachnospiraceae bacterium]